MSGVNLDKVLQSIEEGEDISFDQAFHLARHTDPYSLYRGADRLRRFFHGERLSLCSIVNARSGKCSEDCKFCSQSSFHDTDIEVYDEVDHEFALALALRNDIAGVRRFSLVTAGRSLSAERLERFGVLFELLKKKTSMQLCASMGMLTLEKARILIKHGVSRYHCNLESCRRYFPQVCSSHTWEEKVESIRAAQEAGLDVCSGGIIGMGEQLEHRLELAFELRDLGIASIPINILNPIDNTAFAGMKPLTLNEVLTAVAMFRLVNPKAVIRLAGGRGQLGEDQAKCFASGANGAIVGDYLTTTGNGINDDLDMFRALGFDMSGYNTVKGKGHGTLSE